MEVAILTQNNHFLINDSTRRLVAGLHCLGFDVVVFRTSATPKGKTVSKVDVLKEMANFVGFGFVLNALAMFARSKIINSDRRLRRSCKIVDIPDDQELTPEIFLTHCRDLEVLLILSGTRIIGKDVIELWTHGVLNVHSSILPYSRGLMPALWTYANDKGMGVTLFRLNEQIDGGTIIYQVPIEKREPSYLDHLRRTKEISVGLFLTWAMIVLMKAETPREIEASYNRYPPETFKLKDFL